MDLKSSESDDCSPFARFAESVSLRVSDETSQEEEEPGWCRSTLSSLAHVVGIFTASFGSELWIMFVTLGLGVGLGNGLMSCPMLAVMSQYFTKRRAMAVGITMCGSCTGGLIYSSILRQLISSLGFPWTMRVIALIQFVTLAFANICLRPRTSAKSISGWVDWTAFRDVRFNHYAIATFMSLLGLYISIFFIVDFSRTSISPSLSYRNGLSLLMIFNGVNAIGRFGSGLAADKFGVLGVFVPVLVATSLTLFTWISVRTVPSMYVWTVFCGIFCGGIQSLFPAGLGYLTAGTEQPGTRMGMVFGLGSIASLIGSPIVGALVGAMDGNYLGAQVFGGATMALSALFLEATRRADKRMVRCSKD
ncbi:Riboflavin transporter MCH5 [Fusarium oxysporum f. sp. cubense race 1]|uniref:Riboflavin transporter MCH5 n=1 Tax=Fusarium oxysporum f. sp. cubense (strain race 1) TaxID=1229664 RepID=N4UG35_FUSC1|nr:Riboflavin transporter MCH5 [Fusarium oxysporum f. sp. cubense race 1]